MRSLLRQELILLRRTIDFFRVEDKVAMNEAGAHWILKRREMESEEKAQHCQSLQKKGMNLELDPAVITNIQCLCPQWSCCCLQSARDQPNLTIAVRPQGSTEQKQVLRAPWGPRDVGCSDSQDSRPHSLRLQTPTATVPSRGSPYIMLSTQW